MSNVPHAYCDRPAARDISAAPAAAHPNLVLITTILASSLAFVDGSVVNVALPAIGTALSANADALQWTINAYLLPLSAMLLLGGAAGDSFGRRRVLVMGITLFGIASLACALSPALPMLLVARFIQGAGAAALMPNSLAILGQTFSGAAKGRAVGIWAATSAIAGAVGPVLGGWLIDLGSWRAIFLINLPLASVAIFMALRYVPKEPERGGAALDLRGAALVTSGLGALTWALTVGTGPGGWTLGAVVSGIAGAALLVWFARVEKQQRDRALMPLHLFASKSFVGLSVLTLLLYGAFSALLVLVPYVLIEANGYSGTAAGAALLPLPIILTVGSPLMGAVSGRTGPRLPIAIGSFMVGVGLLLTLRVQAGTSYWSGLLPAILVTSAGLTAAVAPLTTAVLVSADARYIGAASGFNSATARTGSLIATALLGAVLASRGAQLLASFHTAMVLGACTCFAAAFIAYALVKR